MGEVVVYASSKSGAVINGEIVGTNLILTRSDGSTVTIPLSDFTEGTITQGDLDTAVATKVAKAGDTMTGPLVLSGDPTLSLHAATMQYVLAQLAALVDSSPGALNTLNELAAALNDDPNFASTITTLIGAKLTTAGHSVNSIPVSISGSLADLIVPTSSILLRLASGDIIAGTVAQAKTLLAIAEGDVTNLVSDLALKAPLASPTLTGTPVAPTAGLGTNTTQLATTAYVQTEVALKATLQEVVNNHGNTGSAYTIPDVTTATVHRVTLNAATVTFTMPTAGTGKSFVVKAKQDSTGGRLAVFTGVIWPGGTAPTLATVASHADTLVFYCIDGAVWEGALAGGNYVS